MALIKSVRGFTPQIGENTYLSENATIVGDVTIGKDCSIWFNAVLRGDVNPIRIGDRVNIQDGSVLHTLYERSVVEIGNDVSVGPNVTIHGATVKDGALIGMGATVLTGARIGRNCIVGGGAVVTGQKLIRNAWLEMETTTFEEAEAESPEAYLRQKHGKDADQFRREVQPDGSVHYVFDTGCVKYTYEFTQL